MRSGLPLSILFFLTTLGCWADEAKATVVLRPLEQPAGDASELAASLGETWAHQWTKAGFSLVDGTEGHPARFEARGVIVREKGNLVLQVSVMDTVSRSVVASDMLSVFEGLTAFEPVNGALDAITARTRAYWDEVKAHPLPVAVVQDALVFLSPDDGAQVFWLGHEAVGTIVDGQVTAPYHAFPSNAVLTVSIEKPGWRSQTVNVQLDPADTTYKLPALDKLRTQELHLFSQSGRLLGVGAEYRNYFVPDWAFWSAEASPFVQYRPDVAHSRPVLHLDTSGSVGTWLYFGADSWFRFGVEASFGLLQTWTISADHPGWYLDATLAPFDVVFEWKIFGFLLENRVQVPYSLGLPTGLVGPQWMLIDGNAPMLSLGVVTRW